MFIGQSIEGTVFIGVIFLIREGDRQTAPLPMLGLALLFLSVCHDCFKTYLNNILQHWRIVVVKGGIKVQRENNDNNKNCSSLCSAIVHNMFISI